MMADDEGDEAKDELGRAAAVPLFPPDTPKSKKATTNTITPGTAERRSCLGAPGAPPVR